MNKKKIYIVSGMVAFVIIGGVIGVSVLGVTQGKATESVYKEVNVEKGDLISGVTESGSVSLGTVSQTLDIGGTSDTSSSGSASANSVEPSTGKGGASGNSENTSGSSSSSSGTDAELVVEEVYVSLGENVQEGDAILKITDDSLEEYREELEEMVKSAELTVEEAQLNAKSQTLDAEYSYEENIANGSVAQQKYDATIASLNSQVTEAQEKLNESAAKIAEYQQRIAAGENLSSELAEEQANYNSLENELKTAQSNLTTKSITAKQEYEQAMLNYNNASNILAVDTNGINDDVEEAQEALTEAQTALEEFNTLIGDGTIYAEYSGTILECGYTAGDVLSTDTTIVSFADAEAVTMTVSVSQEDIGIVEVGNSVEIEMTAYEDEVFEGVVSGIETATSSGSSTVSYNVTVVFSGDVSKIYADMTGNVTFVTKEVKDVVYVSNKAIQKEGTKSYVIQQKEDGTKEKVEVTTGFSDGVNVEIVSGLTEGETVLIEGKVTEE